MLYMLQCVSVFIFFVAALRRCAPIATRFFNVAYFFSNRHVTFFKTLRTTSIVIYKTLKKKRYVVSHSGRKHQQFRKARGKNKTFTSTKGESRTLDTYREKRNRIALEGKTKTD